MATHDQTTAANEEKGISRREAVGGIIGAGAIGAMGLSTNAAVLDDHNSGYDKATRRYTLPDLPYDYDALEPVIDAKTMRLHHGTHHQGYVNGLNAALDMLESIRNGQSEGQSVKHWSRQLAFHGSGHVNHAIFWDVMAPAGEGGGGMPGDTLRTQIRRDFGTFEKFKAHFVAASSSVEGSGWGWLAWEPVAQRLLVFQVEKHQNLMMNGMVPLMGIDVWEHAYYLNYQNRRGEYVSNWFDVVNWDRVAQRFEMARG